MHMTIISFERETRCRIVDRVAVDASRTTTVGNHAWQPATVLSLLFQQQALRSANCSGEGDPMTDSAPSRPGGTMPLPAPTDTAQTYWDSFYRGRQPYSGPVAGPNPLLLRETGTLRAGTALELGCGAGRDAIWLAERGWRVTAVDVSATVLARAAAAAAQAGVADRIDWQEHDLTRSFPAGVFDLVSAQFLHSPVAGEREREAVFVAAAAAVAPGGTLLVISHAGFPSWLSEPPPEHLAAQLVPNSVILDAVQAESGKWVVETDRIVTRERIGPTGEAGTSDDAVLRIRRLR